MAILTVTAAIIPNTYAGGPRHDFDESYSNVPGAYECWIDGFDDGANDSYNEDRANECEEKGDQYNVAFDVGARVCNDPELGGVNENDCIDAKNGDN